MEKKIIWAAGLIDGEGCIHIHKRKPGAPSRNDRSPVYYIELFVKMCHKPAVEILMDIFQCGKIYRHDPGKLSKRVAWTWAVSGRKVEKIINMILPFLIVKRAEAEAALVFIKGLEKTKIRQFGVTPIQAKFREDCYQLLRSLKTYEWK